MVSVRRCWFVRVLMVVVVGRLAVMSGAMAQLLSPAPGGAPVVFVVTCGLARDGQLPNVPECWTELLAVPYGDFFLGGQPGSWQVTCVRESWLHLQTNYTSYP